MNMIILTENVDDWQLENSSDSYYIIDIVLPTSQYIKEIANCPIVVWIQDGSHIASYFYKYDGTPCIRSAPKIIPRKPPLPYTLNDIIEISNCWFRLKGKNIWYKIINVKDEKNPSVILFDGNKIGKEIKIDKLIDNYEYSNDGKNWYLLMKYI